MSDLAGAWGERATRNVTDRSPDATHAKRLPERKVRVGIDTEHE